MDKAAAQKFSDESRRIADEMTLHAVARSEGWVAFRLSDGTPLDHVCYPTRMEAVRAARWDRDNFIYLEAQPDGMHPRDAQAVLNYARALHKAGFRIPSPEFDFDPTMPLMKHDRIASIRHLSSGGKR